MIKKILVPPTQQISGIVTACITYEKHSGRNCSRTFSRSRKIGSKDKTVFFKALSCVLLFKTEAPGIPLTFESILELKSVTNRRGCDNPPPNSAILEF